MRRSVLLRCHPLHPLVGAWMAVFAPWAQGSLSTAEAIARIAGTQPPWQRPDEGLHGPPAVIISACLAGHAVTYNAGQPAAPRASRLPSAAAAAAGREQKLAAAATRLQQRQQRPTQQHANLPIRFLLEVLAQQGAGVLAVHALCPEVDILGMSVPRNPIKIVVDHSDASPAAAPRNALSGLIDAVSGLPLRPMMPTDRTLGAMPLGAQLQALVSKREAGTALAQSVPLAATAASAAVEITRVR